MMKTFTAPPPLMPPPPSLTDTNTFFSPPTVTSPSSSGFFPQMPHFSLPSYFLGNSHGFHPLPLPPPPPVVKLEAEQYRVPSEAFFGQQHQWQQQQQQSFCFPSPNPSASATTLLQRATMMGTMPTSDSFPLVTTRSHAEHESIDLLQDMNLTATMMMSSITPEGGLGFDGGSSIDGILDPKGGGAGGGKGATRDFLNLGRGFPLLPQRKVDILSLCGDNIGMHMQEEEEEGQGHNDNNNDNHQHNIWFSE